MTIQIYLKKIFFILIVACPYILCGQVLSDTLPKMNSFVEGKLPNGLRYYIRNNNLPKGKAELRLILNVGSVQETEKESGASHFLEHMLFNGTETFPNNTILTLFEYMGIKFGYDINAFTGYDQTIYIMPVPTDEDGNIDLALKVLKEWLSAARLEAKDIEKEKKIILQEKRDDLQTDPFYDLKIKDSHFAKRYVLGSEKTIMNLDSISLRNYYDRWYRPDLATIVVVGDCNPQEVEEKIKELYTPLSARSKYTPPVIKYSLPTKSKNLYKAIPDKFINNNRLELIIPVKNQKLVTYEDLRNNIKIDFFKELIYNRLKEDPTLNCSFSRNWFFSDIDHSVFELSGDSDATIIDKIRKLGYSLAQISQHGFLPEEMDKVLKKMSTVHPYSDTIHNSSTYCDNIVNLVINGDRQISKDLNDAFRKKILPSITQEELKIYVDEVIEKNRRRIWCYRYNPTLSNGGSKKAMNRAWLTGIKSKTIPYSPPQKEKKELSTKQGKTLPNFELKESKVVSQKYFEKLNITEMMLSNGLRLIIKPIKATEGKEIMLSLSGRGGFSILPKGEYPFYESTAAYMEMAGAASLTSEELSDYAYDQKVAIVLNIFNYHHEMSGIAFHGNLETMLKLLYAKVVESSVPYKEIEEDKKRKIAILEKENQQGLRFKNSESWQRDNILVDIKGEMHSEHKNILTKDEINHLNADSIFAFYEKLFGCTERLTAVVSGNINNEKDIQLLISYLGALPNRTSCDSLRNVGTNFPQEISRKLISQNEEDNRIEVTTIFNSPFDFSLRNLTIMKLMTNIAQQRILGSLREKHGMVYSPFSTIEYRAFPKSEVYFEVSYSCDKKNEKKLEKLLLAEIERLKKEPISKEELNGLKRAFIISKNDYLDESSPAPWRDKLRTFALEGVSLEEMNNFDEDLESITTKDIQNAFNSNWNIKNYSVITIK